MYSGSNFGGSIRSQTNLLTLTVNFQLIMVFFDFINNVRNKFWKSAIETFFIILQINVLLVSSVIISGTTPCYMKVLVYCRILVLNIN